MSEPTQEKAFCRGCDRELNGPPYYTGKPAYHPDTGARCKVNHYGGFVCSRECDYRASLEMHGSMPGCAGARNLDCFAQIHYNNNWRDES